MEVVYSSEILVNYQTTQHHIPDDSILRSHLREIITFDINYKVPHFVIGSTFMPLILYYQ
jgi:hypothetical protein